MSPHGARAWSRRWSRTRPTAWPISRSPRWPTSSATAAISRSPTAAGRARRSGSTRSTRSPAATACAASPPATCSMTAPTSACSRTSSPRSASMCTIDELGFRRERFADRHLKARRRWSGASRAFPDAIRATADIAERCTFSLRELSYQYPDEIVMSGRTPQEALERLTREALKRQIPGRRRPRTMRTCSSMSSSWSRAGGYAPYFLTVNSIVQFARSQEILCQGRGSAANSMICYVLGITSIDPIEHKLLFERFLSDDRDEPPDIDVDFEHERREEVIQWIYETYGHEPCRADRRGQPLPHPRRGARGRQGAGAFRGCDRHLVRPGLGLVERGRRRTACRGARPRPQRSPAGAHPGAHPPTDRHAAPSHPASRRLRPHPRPARRSRADRAGGDGGSPGRSNGRRTISRN